MTVLDSTDIARFAPSTYMKSGTLGDHFIIGAPGSGKTTQVLALVMDKLTRGLPVGILDSGYSYLPACKLLGGTYVVLHDQPEQIEVPSSGSTPLWVFDFAATHRPYNGQLPGLAGIIGHAGALLVIDDTRNLALLEAPLCELLTTHVASGGNFCVTGQRLKDVEPFRGISDRARMVTLTRA